MSEAGRLWVVGTPIGNLEDLTPRTAETLERADICYAEDTRRTGRLLASLDIGTPVRSLHAHNERARTSEILERLAAGDTVALVSDAGTPTISDPGRRIVEAAHARGVPVGPVPGPSAVTSALSVSGFPADDFLFAGFAPRKGSAREAWISEVVASERAVVLFEAPGRLAGLLEDLAAAGSAARRAVVCRELTKIHEEVRSGTIEALATVYGDGTVKGEVTVVVEGADPPARTVDRAEVREAVRRHLEDGMTRSDIAKRLEERFDVSRNEAYRWAHEDDADG